METKIDTACGGLGVFMYTCRGREPVSGSAVALCLGVFVHFSLFSSLPDRQYAERPLKALLALTALSLRSNMPVLIVLKCNQGLHSRGANNLNLTKHLRRPSTWP